MDGVGLMGWKRRLRRPGDGDGEAAGVKVGCPALDIRPAQRQLAGDRVFL